MVDGGKPEVDSREEGKHWKDRIDLFFVEKTQSADMLKS